MHEEENRFFSAIVKDEKGRLGGGGCLECCLLLRDRAASIRGKKALIVEVEEGGRETGRERSREREVWHEEDNPPHF